MGYHLTILKTSESKQIKILLEDAVKCAQELNGWKYDPTPDPTFTFTLSEGTITLWYDKGELWTKSQGRDWELDPLITLANSLGARVRGDELETYESPVKTYFHPDDEALKNALELEGNILIQKELREQRRIRNYIVLFFIVLGVIAFAIGKQFES